MILHYDKIYAKDKKDSMHSTLFYNHQSNKNGDDDDD